VSVSKLDRYATSLPPRVDPDQDQHAFIVDVDEALGIEAQLRPRPLLAESPQLVNTPHHGPVGIRCCEIELGVRCHPLGPSGEQDALLDPAAGSAGSRVALTDQPDVFLRHRPRSISRSENSWHGRSSWDCVEREVTPGRQLPTAPEAPRTN
jgi:hypothetical protein